MFDKLKDMGKLVKQAKEMKDKMKDIQDQLREQKVQGSSFGDKIQIEMTGELEVISVKISDDMLSAAMAEKLTRGLAQAFNEAAKKAKQLATSRLADISGDLNLPGM